MNSRFFDDKRILVERILQRPLRRLHAFGLYLLLAGLFVLPIILAGVDYIDDTARRLGGDYQWGSLGRFFAEALMHVVTFSFGNMVDVGGLSQILSILVVAGSGYLMVRIVSVEGRITMKEWLIGAVLVVNPLTLTNLSFRYDSLSMMSGQLVALAAALVMLKGKRKLRVFYSGILLFCAAAFYQSMTLMYLVGILLGLAVQYMSGQKYSAQLWRKAVVSFGVFVFSGGLYFVY